MSTQTIKYCHCHFSFENARIELGRERWANREVWICNQCNGMHHVRQVWTMPKTVKRAPKGAVGFLSINHRDTGPNELRYSTVSGKVATILSIHTHNRRPLTMPIQPTDLLLHTWNVMDAKTKMVMEGIGDSGVKMAARAVAEVLAPMMTPFFTDPDSIVREAVQRYRNRDNPEYETPGLGQTSLAPHDVMPTVHTLTAPAKPTEAELSEKDIEGIKTALKSGMFPVKTLASTYKVSEETIKSYA